MSWVRVGMKPRWPELAAHAVGELPAAGLCTCLVSTDQLRPVAAAMAHAPSCRSCDLPSAFAGSAHSHRRCTKATQQAVRQRQVRLQASRQAAARAPRRSPPPPPSAGALPCGTICVRNLFVSCAIQAFPSNTMHSLALNLQRRGCRRPQAAAAAAGSSNLGVLAPLAAPEPAEFVPLPPEQLVQFSGGGVINVDGGAIAASLLCLALVLALSLNRILGLERLLG